MKLKFALLTVTLAAAPAFAMHAARLEASRTVPLAAGETLYVFKDGLMAKENRFGRAIYLQPGEVLVSADGQKIKAVGNEVARLSSLLMKDHKN
jgi:hypothetical protein